MCAMKIFVDPICSRVADPNFKAIPLLIIYNFHPRADSCQQIHSAARPQVRLPSTCPNLGRSVLSPKSCSASHLPSSSALLAIFGPIFISFKLASWSSRTASSFRQLSYRKSDVSIPHLSFWKRRITVELLPE